MRNSRAYSPACVLNGTAAAAECFHDAGMLSGAAILSLGLSLAFTYIVSRAGNKVASWAKVPSRNPKLMTCQTAELARPQSTE